MQTAPNGGSGHSLTRPSRERVGARGSDRGDLVSVVRSARQLVRQQPGSPGDGSEGWWRRWRPGLPGRQPTRTKRWVRKAQTARASALAPRPRWSSFPREFPPRKVRRALSGHVDPLEGVAMGTSPRSAWSRVPQSLGPGRSERDVFAGWQQQANHTRRSERNRNPTSGSGPRDRNVAGEQTVEGVRNSEDGTCRVRQARVERTLLPMSLKGRQNPTRGTGDCHSFPGNRTK